MRTPLLIGLFLAAATPTLAQGPAPCTHAVTACERWVVHGTGPARSMVYATYSLDTRNTTITRALIMVHGANRNADHYFETATTAGFIAGALGNTIIIAPRFSAATDKVAPNEVLWPERGENWRSGGAPTSLPNVGSFDFVDEIVRKLADKKIFPNLTNVVIAGHSAGGQFATRYEMSNKIHGTLGVAMSYVVANPSTYAWPSAVRPLPTGDANPATADKEALGDDGEKVHTAFTFGPFDSTKVRNYDAWPAGLEKRKGYTAQISDAQMRKQLAERPTTYLLGQVDVLPLGGFDSSPTAMTQGPTRRARGEAFTKFVQDSLGGHPTVMIVPECGHNDRCIFTTDMVFPALFPK